jgi:hypothetical protein
MKSVISVVKSFTRMRPFAESPDTEAESETETELSDDREPSLFACRECDSVYIALEKQTCSSCRTAVERVPATVNNT